MDWAKIVKVLKANGYTGDGSDLAAVKAFAADFNLVGEDGNAIDLDAAHKAFASKSRKPLVVPSEDVDAIKAENARLKDPAAEPTTTRRTSRRRSRSVTLSRRLTTAGRRAGV